MRSRTNSLRTLSLTGALPLLALLAGCGGGGGGSSPSAVTSTPVATTPTTPVTTPVATTPVAPTPVATTPAAPDPNIPTTATITLSADNMPQGLGFECTFGSCGYTLLPKPDTSYTLTIGKPQIVPITGGMKVQFIQAGGNSTRVVYNGSAGFRLTVNGVQKLYLFSYDYDTGVFPEDLPFTWGINANYPPAPNTTVFPQGNGTDVVVSEAAGKRSEPYAVLSLRYTPVTK